MTGRRRAGGHRRQPRPRRGGRVRRGQPRPLRGRQPRPARSSSGGSATSGWPIRARPGGGTEHVELPAVATQPCLTDAQLRALAALGAGSRRTTGSRRTPSGRSTRTARCGSPRPARSPRCSRCPDAPARPTATCGCTSASTWRRALTRPLTPMGLQRSGVLGVRGRAAVRLSAGRPARRSARRPSRPGSGSSSTSRRRPQHASGGRSFPRVLDVMEARSAAVLRGLFDDPRLVGAAAAPGGRSARRLARGARRASASRSRSRRRWSARAAARRRVDRIEARLREPATAAGVGRPRRSGWTPSWDCSATPSSRSCRGSLPAAAAGFAMLGAGRPAARRPTHDPATWQTVLRGLPHNVTTEMDLDLWGWPTAVRGRRGGRAGAAPRTRPRSWPRGTAPARCPPALQDGLARFLDRYGHRAVAEIDLGVPRWADDPTHILGVLANYLRLDDPAPRAGRGLRPRRRARPRRMVATLTPRARRRGRLRGRAVGFALDRTRAARRAAGAAQVPTSCWCSPSARRELARRSARTWRRAGRLGAADDVFFLDLARGRAPAWTGARPARRRRATGGATTTASCAAGTCPRVLLSDGTEPEARGQARRRRRTARSRGTPASAGDGHRSGAGGARPRRAPTSSRARSWSRRRPTPAGRRSSSPPAGW